MTAINGPRDKWVPVTFYITDESFIFGWFLKTLQRRFSVLCCFFPRYNAVWIIFFILGLGTLLPWNFFITATMVISGWSHTSPPGCDGCCKNCRYVPVMLMCTCIQSIQMPLTSRYTVLTLTWTWRTITDGDPWEPRMGWGWAVRDWGCTP